MEPILLKYRYSKGDKLTYKIHAETEVKIINEITSKSIVDSIASMEVKDMDAAGNYSVETVYKSFDLLVDGKKMPNDEYIGKVIKMKLNQNGDLIESSDIFDLTFSVYPEEPKKIKDEWTTVNTSYEKGVSEPIKIEKKYVFSEVLKYNNFDVAKLNFFCPSSIQVVNDQLFNETTMKGEELFDFNNGRLIKVETISNINTFQKSSLINTIQMKIKFNIELINNSEI